MQPSSIAHRVSTDLGLRSLHREIVADYGHRSRAWDFAMHLCQISPVMSDCFAIDSGTVFAKGVVKDFVSEF